DLPSNNSLSFAEKESFHFDIPSFSRPSAKPLDGDTLILNIKIMGDIYDQKDFMHKLMIALAPHQEKSPDILSHGCGTVKKFNTHRSHLNKYPMMIHGQNNPPLDVLFKDSGLKDSIDQTDLVNLDDYFVDPIPEMFTDEHAPDYSFPLRFDVYDDDFLEVESDVDNVYDNPFDSKEKKIKEDDDLPLPNNEYKVFNPGILIQEKLIIIITRVAQKKKLAISYASLMLKDFDPPFYELLFFKDVQKLMMLIPFSTENEEKVFKPVIYTSEK
nr:hypothetical protein [Tanacetum cinerariifolium]